MHRDDLPVLKEILSHSVDPIEVIYFTQTLENYHCCVKPDLTDFVLAETAFPNLLLCKGDSVSSPLSQTAGLHPTAEQIEMFAYHLPDATLSNLVVSIVLYLFSSYL